jgi:hypothetical protein
MADIPRAPAIRGQTMRSYAAFEVTSDVYAVSYLAPSGFTLTVVLNLANRQLVGFASGKDQWHPVRGTVEVVG